MDLIFGKCLSAATRMEALRRNVISGFPMSISLILEGYGTISIVRENNAYTCGPIKGKQLLNIDG